MTVSLAARTDAGLVRSDNEDSYYASEEMLIVADGMGGANAGEVASAMAVQHLVASFPSIANLPDGLVDAIQSVNAMVYEAAQDANLQGMGTTLTCAVIKGGSLFVAHVGDSKAYLLRDGKLVALSVDHTVVEELVRSGNLSEEEAKCNPHRHVLTRALGTSPVLAVDVQVRQLNDGDIILLCTDGLTVTLDENEITAIVSESGSLEDAATRLVEMANLRGGPDNITVVLAKIGL